MSQENDNIQKQVTDALMESLSPIVTGTKGDLQNYAQGIVTDAIEASSAGDTATLQQLKDQSSTLLEVNRLRVAAGVDKTVIALVALAIGVISRFVLPIPLSGSQTV